MNILENINLDQVGYCLTTNTGAVATGKLKLNPQRMVILNGINVINADVVVKQSDLCVSVAICINSQKADCIDGTKNSKNICVSE